MLEAPAYCGSLITVNHAGRVTRILPNQDHPLSRGAFASKACAACRNGPMGPTGCCIPCGASGRAGPAIGQQISWDAALDEIADRLTSVRAKHGPLSLVGAVSGAAFSRGPIVALLMRSLGSPNWMINQDLCGGCRF